jgi:hypothetical protein
LELTPAAMSPRAAWGLARGLTVFVRLLISVLKL